MRPITSAVCLAGMLLLADGRTAAAQRANPIQTRFGIELLTSGVDAAQAETAGVSTRAWGVQFAGGVTLLRVVTLSADAGALGLGDEAHFSQPTTEGDKTSSVTAGMGSLAVGLQTPPLRLEAGKPGALSAGVSVGHSWLSAHRSISRCADCHSEDVEIRAGSFWEPGVQLDMGRWGLSARYRTYGGDATLRDAVMIGYYSTLRGRGAKAADEDAPAAIRGKGNASPPRSGI